MQKQKYKKQAGGKNMAVMMIPKTMVGATLPGNSTVEMKEFEIPKPGHGEVLIQTKATTICGSDIRCIYREHTGKGAEGGVRMRGFLSKESLLVCMRLHILKKTEWIMLIR